MRTTALAELAAQLKFVPVATARRQIERAEALLGVIDAKQTYPEDWLVHHITGYRPEMEEAAMLVGEAVLADLGGLVERLSVAAKFDAAELAGWLSVGELCDRWGVSRKTLERYRRLGLLSRRVRDEERGKPAARFSPAVVAWFERVHGARVARAGKFSRIDGATGAKMMRRAAGYKRKLGWTRTAAAHRLAGAMGRSKEAVRQRLARLDAVGARAVFRVPTRMTPARAREIERAWRESGARPSEIAKRFKISAATVHRVVRSVRTERLLALGLEDDAGAVRGRELDALLHRDEVRLGLGAAAPMTMAEVLADAAERGWPDAGTERRRVAAYRGLVARAAREMAGLRWPGASALALDGVATDLLWAARLKAELVRAESLLLVRTIEGRMNLGASAGAERRLVDLPHETAAALWGEAIEAASEAVERFDGARGGRLAAPVGIAVNRVLAKWFGAGRGGVEGVGATGRRTGRPPHQGGTTSSTDWTRAVCPWQAFLEAPAGLREAIETASDADRAIVVKRQGWMVSEPITIARLAEELKTTAARAVVAERRAMARLLGGRE
ncbi:MAG: hypothetical protein ACKVS8_02710 [Phycisphaerales bacterium]